MTELSDIEVLERNVSAARAALALAELELSEYKLAPERNQFETVEEAMESLSDVALSEATDCCGHHQMGDDRYAYRCFVGGEPHTVVIDVEYNRHDKQWYYVDEWRVSIRAGHE